MSDDLVARDNFQEKLLAELLVVLEPFTETGGEPTRVLTLLDELGWDGESLLGPGGPELIAQVGAIEAAVGEVRKYLVAGRPPESIPEIVQALGSVALAMEAVRDLPESLRGVDPAALEDLPAELSEYLLLRYVYRRAPAVFRLLRVLTVIETEFSPALVVNGVQLRAERAISRLRPESIAGLLRDPVAHLSGKYLAGGLVDQAAVERLAKTLLTDLAYLLSELGALAVVGRGASPPQLSEEDEAALAGTLTAIWEIPTPVATVELGTTIELVPTDRGGPGVFAMPVVGATAEHPLADWLLRVEADGAIGGFMVTPGSVEFVEASGGAGVDLAVLLSKLGAGGVALRIGSTRGTRLEVGHVAFRADASLRTEEQEYGFLFEAREAAIVVSAGDGDGFLRHILPAEGLRVEFELGIGWSKSRGVYFAGAAGLEATLPVELSLLGVINLDSVYLALRADEHGVRAIAGVTTSLQLGPVAINVERFGLQALLAFPPAGGNLGAADLQFAFKPPSGAGIAVDASVVVGGGYLFFDPERAQYAGVLQLEIARTVSLKAIGLLTTRMPDGSEGFSLVIIVSAEGFAPIQLGFGFALTGVGGILGVNRSVLVDALRAGIKHGTLDSILFPPDPVANAPQILSTLSTVFPPQQGRFFFGPMAQIAWGTPAVLTIDLALVLEVPSPVRLLILGRLKVVLPEAEHAVVYLRLDALGVIDFERGDLSLDATLYDSRIAQFVVTGDMALRASWGDQPVFVLAVGGFNPRFRAPAGFPSLDRVAITLAAGDNPRLRMEAYLALTANTVQFGARLEASARAGDFTLEGFFGFDALVNLAPFAFLVEVGGMAALRHKRKLLMGITLDMVLSGPTPWHVRGRATFAILGFSHEIRFEHRIGDDQAPPLPLRESVVDRLREALEDVRNWAGELPAGENPLVSFRDGGVRNARLVHPLAALTVRQKVVPLDTVITRFGGTRPSDGNRFTVTVASDDGVGLAATRLEDAFAPGQFRDMTDEQKLTSPSFTRMHSGWRFATDAYAFDYGAEVRALDTNISYDTLTVLEPEERAASPTTHVLRDDVLRTAALFGPAGAAGVRHTGNERYRLAELVEV